MATDYFQGYPRGWFVVAMSDEIGVGQVKSLSYFGQRMAAFRGEDGEVRVIDAYCPHLGADLGVGGVVVGNAVKCPFHAWQFDGRGRCVDIPYAEKIPKKAAVKPWTVAEKDGLVFVWNDDDDLGPDWDLPTIAPFTREAYTPWSAKLLHIKTHPREVIENIADSGHFLPVHGTDVSTFDNDWEGHIARQRTTGVAYPRGGGKDRFNLTATYYGPGYQITEMHGVLDSVLLLAHTPIDKTQLHLRFGVAMPKAKVGDHADAFTQGYIKNLQVGFEEDIQIWENKQYRPDPVFCDGDGPVGKARRWYRQFYVARSMDRAIA